jgi:asparagine synthase (glutamine-hydrolysing)
MPGIAGIISKARNHPFENDVDLMVRSMMHESFYSSKKYFNKSIGFYAGWVGLKGLPSVDMPIWNERNDLCLIFSGEDFNGRDFIGYLKEKGHEFDPSDSNYLIHLYEEEGDKFFERLSGNINGALVDLSKERIILFNDRYGMQRLYFHESKDAFYFASEAKSLLKVNHDLRDLDYKGFGERISCGCVLENRTLFKNIFIFPCASKWTFQNGIVLKKEKYFDFGRWENDPILDGEDYYNRLKERFPHILPRYYRSEESIGMSLTGGMDTRIIMAYLDLRSDQLPCYTFGGMYRDSADVKIARRVAEACRQPHQVIRIGKEFLTDFPKLAEETVYIADGCLDVSGSAELYANRLARDIAPIRLTGNYGSEVLRNNVAFKPNPPSGDLFHPDVNDRIRNAGETYAEIRRGHPLSFIVSKQVPWHHYGRFALEQSQVVIRSPFLDNDLVGLAYQAPQDVVTGDIVSQRLIKNGNAKLFEMETDRGNGGNSGILFSTCRRMFQEFTFKAEYAYDYGMPQWMAKLDHVFESFQMERIFLGRHKFYHFRSWYKNELSGYVREILLDERALKRPYLNGSSLKKMVEGHTKGICNYTVEINKVLTLELIHRLFLDS